MPAMSPTMTEGGISRWVKQEGESFVPGDVILEIETDKAQMEVEAQEEGVLAKILVPANEGKVAVNAPIAVLAEEGDDLSNLEIPDLSGEESGASTAKADQESAARPAETAPTSDPKSAASTQKANLDLPLSPAVGHLLELYELKPAQIGQASGPKGRLLKGDVLRYLATQNITKPPSKQAPTPVTSGKSSGPAQSSTAAGSPAKSSTPAAAHGASYTDIPLSNMRRIIASRLTESKATVPHSYIKQDLTMDKLLQLRQHLKATSDVRVSVNDFIIRAAALALRDTPEANVRFNPDASTDEVATQQPTVDISVAVATPAGLITPIIKHADQKGIATISAEMKALADRARLNKLKPDEYQGGTFSISNLGMFGVNDFTAVINPPQACILAVGGTRQVASPAAQAKAMDDTLDYLISGKATAPAPAVPAAPIESGTSTIPTPIVASSTPVDLIDVLAGKAPLPSPALPASADLSVKNLMTVSLSIDERAVDAVSATKFLQRLKYYVDQPERMLL
ncbi:hypothetical protein IWQ60_011368 [Tieghemiomyces parasiticus]|uniref:Dihydrolipoamide acetyltransferase component of pyruvate dehydrogenase complex n=1 Tax=Tieghemiomyces parasiticus TaxID=78921 RepID=A0A9W7ZN37_9FUNG|nr:hypothetical protein IWQ60_011368 [Tieghemiomyces parasiticus]